MDGVKSFTWIRPVAACEAVAELDMPIWRLFSSHGFAISVTWLT